MKRILTTKDICEAQENKFEELAEISEDPENTIEYQDFLKQRWARVIDSDAEEYCGHERPARKVLCQLKKGHKESHRAIIYWED